MTTNEYLRATYDRAVKFEQPRAWVHCADGFSVSIQANRFAYCNPRITHAGDYVSVELGFPTRPDDLIMEYAEDPSDPTETVYGYVPVEVVDALLEKHGGIVVPKIK